VGDVARRMHVRIAVKNFSLIVQFSLGLHRVFIAPVITKRTGVNTTTKRNKKTTRPARRF
jgi:hypothetical protein